ncbi:MAG: 4Fe-4S binding protein [Candidatus Aureabacteria bacterium]|nr:4Fe-4S binding protein [Candidatus Auribacterota bacterium]
MWFLPLIVIGGLFQPLLGYLVSAMMAVLLVLSYFKRRYWCWHICPRGAFLDIVLSKLSRNKPIPKLFTKQWFRWVILILSIVILILRLLNTGGNLIAIGTVFVVMCLVTTVVSIVIGIPGKHRGWCAICPMGTLQEKINNATGRVK